MDWKIRWTVSLAAVLTAGLLCACGGKPSDTSQPDSSGFASLEQPVDLPDPEPVYPYTNPLTGEGCMEDISQNRPIAIMLNNLKQALPQLGVAEADIIYEALAEGGITRMLAVYQSVDGVGEIGSVRSAREYYVSLALGHDALFLHAGGSPGAYTAIDNWGVAAFDCVNGPYEGTLFWRDKDRRVSMGLEHSVVTSGEVISQRMPTYSYRLTHKDGFSLPLVFMDKDETAQGDPAQTVEVVFSTYKTGVFTYDEETGLYQVEEYGAPYVDGNTDQQVSVKNVLVLRTDVSSVAGDSAGRLDIRTTGTGSGLFCCDGTVQEITWSKESNSAPMSYFTQDGQPLELGVGQTYVNLVGRSSSVTIS